MWEKRMPIVFWWESQKDRNQWNDLDVSGIIILTLYLSILLH
jgi:hypothetical protein